MKVIKSRHTDKPCSLKKELSNAYKMEDMKGRDHSGDISIDEM
jgi:hypothetical protein